MNGPSPVAIAAPWTPNGLKPKLPNINTQLKNTFTTREILYTIIDILTIFTDLRTVIVQFVKA